MKELYVCEYCGDKVEELNTTTDGYQVCDSCYDNQTYTCPKCGDVHLYDDNFVKIGDDWVCEDCADEAIECACCDELCWEENMVDTQDGLVCPSCEDDYFRCDCCDELVYRNNLSETEDRYDLCPYCWENETIEDDEGYVWYDADNVPSSLIKNYSYKPYPKFYGASQNYDTPIFFGVELEIGEINDDYCKEELASDLESELGDFAYFKEDGSLEYGFEIVTHPATIDYFKSSQFFEKIEEVLLHKARAFNKGGMHIHISRKAFKDDDHLGRFIFFLNYHNSFSQVIAQRNSDRWAAWYKDSLIPNPNTPVSLTQYYNLSGDRYKAINLENEATIEVRIFNANIYANRNLKNLEFLDAVLKFTAEGNYKLDEFLKFIQKPEYVNLTHFLENRKEKWENLKYSYDFKDKKDILKEVFLPFLKENGIKEQYFNNLEENIKNIEPYDYFNIAFMWGNTSEGFSFWSNLNKKWREYLQNTNLY